MYTVPFVAILQSEVDPFERWEEKETVGIWLSSSFKIKSNKNESKAKIAGRKGFTFG